MSKTGIIYKLVSRDVNITELYVGSTCSFRARKCAHKKSCNNENDKSYKYNIYQYIRANGGWDTFDMIQVEEFKHDTKQELHARERYWIEELKASLNKFIPTRTMSEWYQDNKEAILEYQKHHYQTNKEAITAYKKQYNQNNKEAITEWYKHYRQVNKEYISDVKKQYWQNNKKVIAEKHKQYQQNNKEAIEETRKQIYTCECGSAIRIDSKLRHNKTAKHLAWIATEIIEA